MEFSRKVKFTLDGEIYFKRINNKSLCSLLTERVTAVCEEQTKLGKAVRQRKLLIKKKHCAEGFSAYDRKRKNEAF